MADYSNLAKLDVTGETTREYTFDRIPGRPSIVLASATDSNAAFLNERLRLSIERSRKPVEERRGDPTPERMAREIADERETDRILIARTCARGWGVAPTAADGSAPEFSAENCLDFLRALPDWMFDPLRGFAANVYNFAPSVIDEKAGETLGNV